MLIAEDERTRGQMPQGAFRLRRPWLWLGLVLGTHSRCSSQWLALGGEILEMGDRRVQVESRGDIHP